MKSILRDIKKSLDKWETIYIGSHYNPDGDNLGSSLALSKALKLYGKDVTLLYVDEIPNNYLFLPGIDEIKNKKIEDVKEDYIFIALDCGDFERLGRNKDIAKSSSCLINIDHHSSNPMYGDLNLVDDKAAATGELIYDLIKYLEIPIDNQIATCLYTAISTDTGSFKYGNTRGYTHEIIADLYNYKIDVEKINIALYQNKSINQVILHNKVIGNSKLYFNNKVIIGEVSKELLLDLNANIEDSEGIVETIRDIEGVELAVILKEEDNYVRVSTRSKSYFDVSKLCQKFGGGGHIRAAGCSINTDIKLAKEKLLKEIELMI